MSSSKAARGGQIMQMKSILPRIWGRIPMLAALCSLGAVAVGVSGSRALDVAPRNEPATTVKTAKTPLSATELTSIMGGVSADVQWPASGPWYQSYDNLRFDVDIDN
ncbi:MAG: hypothetical protein AAFV29_16085, partial [Myxococcota bacterium]